MKKLTNILVLSLSAFLLSGCGLLPYHDDDACALEGNYGKCIDGLSAYDEALANEEVYGNYIGEDGLTDEAPKAVKAAEKKEGAEVVQSGLSFDNFSHKKNNGYIKLKDRTYEELTTLIEKPDTPMVKPVKIVSHLILNYKTMEDKRHMYMPRYVYTIASEPEFILNQYMLKKEDDAIDILKMLK
ncbi:TPA: TraV family lipoprotein [Vibrio cholerae]|uniref:TraV family lipoprotein n=1 Tax=Vibrio cholerae TaxID=666 RepID=UPI000B4C74F0|nr:TraV family lipoprotein [Vibrio cholerae]OWO68916.1 hypothetical protein B2J68_18700 [Vibrio cholerae]HDZ9258535.1 TraV family lipoprotein [Vibrio cholerae]